MAEIVLVHGIGQEFISREELEIGPGEHAWLPALARGVKTAGFEALSERIWRDDLGRGDLEVRMAFYGNLFLVPGQQGDEPAPFDDEKAELAEQLAEEWLERAASRAFSTEIQTTARRELVILRGEAGEAQGAGEVVRVVAGVYGHYLEFLVFLQPRYTAHRHHGGIKCRPIYLQQELLQLLPA